MAERVTRGPQPPQQPPTRKVILTASSDLPSRPLPKWKTAPERESTRSKLVVKEELAAGQPRRVSVRLKENSRSSKPRQGWSQSQKQRWHWGAERPPKEPVTAEVKEQRRAAQSKKTQENNRQQEEVSKKAAEEDAGRDKKKLPWYLKVRMKKREKKAKAE